MAANCTPTVELPNPCTSLAFLPAESANQLEVSRYLYWATVGVCVLVGLDSIVTRRNPNRPKNRHPPSNRSLPDIELISSSLQVFQATPSRHLLPQHYSSSESAQSTTVQQFVTVIFGALWLGTLGAALALPFMLQGAHIGTTDYCIQTSVKPGASAVVIINACSDTLVFLAISWRLAHNTFGGESWGSRMRSFYKGDGLPRLSKTLLQSGQAYYLATVGLNVATMVMILNPSAPPVYHAFLSLPNIALENSMACRVFRSIHLGTILQSSTSRSLLTSSSLAVRAPSGMIRYEDRLPHHVRHLHSTPLDITVTTDHSSFEEPGKHAFVIDQTNGAV
ncbi:hypothetical protein EDD22DRAFT_959525 [Suillus occidentalis]|nr:hypothetical protein EDD22DRAFT_959525 [Suillus occidentalis]